MARLLPYAVANGFQMDSARRTHKSRIYVPLPCPQYRDFVFHEVLEHSAAVLTTPTANAVHVDETVSNVKELCRLDPACVAYIAHPLRSRQPIWSLAICAVLFLKAPDIPTTTITQLLTLLYTSLLALPPVLRAMPSPLPLAPAPVDPTDRALRDAAHGVRCRRASGEPQGAHCCVTPRRAPAARRGRRAVLAVSQAARARRGVETGFSHALKELTVRCPEIESKGKTLKKPSEALPGVRGRIVQVVPDAGEEARCVRSRAKLGRLVAAIVVGELDSDSEMVDEDGEDSFDEEEETRTTRAAAGTPSLAGGGPEGAVDSAAGAKRGVSELGSIGLENLTTMIRRDLMQPGRVRRRIFYTAALAVVLTASAVPPARLCRCRNTYRVHMVPKHFRLCRARPPIWVDAVFLCLRRQCHIQAGHWAFLRREA
ncbi:hypothetical protein B0H10DRAFT_1942588 [Mycena sp. CBHHK59/15]|nr:hypothetical protein B0H10DRAFT_1942588 [Mycena sp. CBHHK59/15]